MPNTTELGREAERVAEAFYQRNGYQVLARNFRIRHGELDLVLLRGQELLFVEVKGRKNYNPEHCWSDHWGRKKERIRRTVRVFLAREASALDIGEIRLEVVFITQGRVKARFEEEGFF